MLIHDTHVSQRGFTLIEVLVAIVVLSIGLLGMAKLQVSSRQYEMESYQRAQAVILLQDMVNRLNANRSAASCYAITTDNTAGSPWLGTGYSGPPACTTGTTAQQTRAVNDMTEWNTLLNGQSETITSGGSTSNVGAMIGARGCVYYDSVNDQYIVTVAWQGLVHTSAPSGLNCGKNQYGGSSNDDSRRAISAVVKLATLT